MPSSQPTEQEICQRLGQIQIEIARLIEERLALGLRELVSAVLEDSLSY
jgi:hypothetical protein